MDTATNKRFRDRGANYLCHETMADNTEESWELV